MSACLQKVMEEGNRMYYTVHKRKNYGGSDYAFIYTIYTDQDCFR